MGRDALGTCENEMTAGVCSKPLGNTAQGLCDMAGNIWEWVEDDWHDSYSGDPSDAQAWIDSPRSRLRVSRGGSWDYFPNFCRSSARYGYFPVSRYDFLGFRVVLE